MTIREAAEAVLLDADTDSDYDGDDGDRAAKVSQGTIAALRAALAEEPATMIHHAEDAKPHRKVEPCRRCESELYPALKSPPPTYTPADVAALVEAARASGSALTPAEEYQAGLGLSAAIRPFEGVGR